MGWNEPGRDRDPWGGGNDVDEFLSRLRKRLGKRFGSSGVPGRRRGGPRLWWLAPFVIVGVWLLTGFYSVPTGSRAVTVRLGADRGVTGAGVHWHWPWPVASTLLVNVSEQRSLSRRDHVLTADGKLASIELTVRYRVTDPVAYLFGSESPTHVLAALTGAALNAAARTHSLAALRGVGKDNVASGVTERIAKRVAQAHLGVTVGSVHFARIELPKTVAAAQAKLRQRRHQEAAAAASARAAAAAAVVQARRQAHTIVANAQSSARARVAAAQAEVARFEALVPEWKRAPETTERTLRDEAMRYVLSSAPKVVVSGPVKAVTLPAWPETPSAPAKGPAAASASSAATAAGKGRSK